MKLDKALLLIFAMVTIFFIVIVGILTRYGTKISEDPTFSTFFNWYIALVLVNLLNILVTLLFHYFMTDLPGERGDKGKIGPKGLPGEDARCFCDTQESGEKPITLDETNTIHSHHVDTDYGGSLVHSHIDSGDNENKLVIDHSL
tara:strand:- start:882 stop:1316 length:435 start_codon:yes stop_codon:yes gene_type:complete